MGLKDKWNELVYSFRSEDRYADYESHNHHARTADATTASTDAAVAAATRSDGIQLSDLDDGESAGGISHSTEGVSETILAWRHIETWTSEHHSDLNASLADPCTRLDITRAEEDLGIQFPPPVRASLRIHDGQEDLDSLTGSGGLFFSLSLMSLDDIVAKTNAWRLVAQRVELEEKNKREEAARKKLISPIGSSAELDNVKSQSATSLIETKPGYGKVEDSEHVDPDLQRKISLNRHQPKTIHSQIPRQQSCPPGAIQPVYANANWIPLITDNAGNHIGVDLAPGPTGIWGQVIIFGREFDTKFVLAPTWGDFLLNFVKDLESGNYWIYNEEDIYSGDGELVFYDQKLRKEVPYLQVLSSRVINAWRSQQKDLPPQPKSEVKKTHVSHIVPNQPERVISTDITNNKLVDELDDPEESKKTATIEVTEAIVDEPEEEKEDFELNKEVEAVKGEATKELESDKKEVIVDAVDEAAPPVSEESDDKTLINDFKEVAI